MKKTHGRYRRMIDTYVSKVKPAPENTRPSKTNKSGQSANCPKSASAAAV